MGKSNRTAAVMILACCYMIMIDGDISAQTGGGMMIFTGFRP